MMRYEIQISGHLHQRWSVWLYDFEISHRPDGSTALTGVLADDAALYGLLTRLRDLGLGLLAVRRLDDAGDPAG